MANSGTSKDDASPQDGQGQAQRKRRPRRATAPGTGPAAADGPEPRLEDVQPKAKRPKKPLSERDRWMLEEKPPHY